MSAITKKKIALQVSSENHKKAIGNDLKTLAVYTEKTVGNTLLVMGVLFSAIAIYKIFKGDRRKGASGVSHRIMKVLRQQVGLYVLNEGRSKIVAYINSLDETAS